MKVKVPNCVSLNLPERRWFVLRLRSSSNLTGRGGVTDKVFGALQELGYDVYVPRTRCDRYNRRMRVMAEWSEPLIKGYVFIAHPRRGQPADDWDEVRAIDGVAGPLVGERGPLVIPLPLIERIFTEEFEGAYDDTTAGKRLRGETQHDRLQKLYRAGKAVQVQDGPFASFLGTVQKVTDKDRVEVLIQLLGRYVAMEFGPDQLAS
jgi:transcription antitermination factor NusG